ncbi:MAG: hypothetical protein AAF490_09775 [Chloroflexota bacterium]
MIGKEPQISIGVGVILIVVALISVIVTGTSSITAWIPAFFGILLAACGALALNPARLKVMMHIVAVLAVLGALGSLNVIPDLFSGSASAASIISRLVMLVLCGFLVYVSVMSFIQIRKNRQKEA